MKYRLGLDMGATSIGWSVFDIENNRIINTGVRIFDDGREDKSKASLCVKRRAARGMRRLQHRKHIQKEYLLKTLLQYGLCPHEENERQKLKLLNPYELRAKALDEQLSLYEIGRVFFNLAQRKGFLSNRKNDKKEGGKLKAGYEDLQKDMQAYGARTYGEYLYKKWQKNPQQPIRLKNMFDANGQFLGGLFPFRNLYIEEFDAIVAQQKEYYLNIFTDEFIKTLKDILFFQRPLKEQEEGYCIFEENERRIAKAHPLFQKFRMWQHIVNLKFAAEYESEYQGLTKEHCLRLEDVLSHPSEFIKTKQPILTYSQIKSLLQLDKKGCFNFETMTHATNEELKGILVDKTQYAIDQSTHFKVHWNAFSLKEQGEIINVLMRPKAYIDFPKTKISLEQSEELIQNYLCARFNISEVAAHELLNKIDLEDGFASLSEKAIGKILPFLKMGMIYPDACQEAGYHHSVKDFEALNKLPYYGKILGKSCMGQKNNFKNEEEQYGKINNATVHVALNQIRHLVNELIDLYGKPFDISIEYAKDLPASQKERIKLMAERDKNEAENARIRKELNTKIEERDWTKRDIEKYKIWKNMGTPKGENAAFFRECPFSGEKISVSDLLNGQNFQIEHLIPFSRSLDDSIHNKVIATVAANKEKGNRTPYEAFGQVKEGKYAWADIQRRVKKLSFEQQWRFGKDAMKKFEEREGPIARSLNDTRYMTRLLQDYLRPIGHPDGFKNIQAVAGQLTALIRKSWGLNQYKNKEEKDQYRAFHNHHAIDAIIVSAIERAQIAQVAQHLKTVHKTVIEEFKDEFPKLKDPSVSKDDKKELQRRICDFEKARKLAIVAQYIPFPNSLNVSELLKQVESIHISHKPKLKNIRQKDSTVGQLHEDTAYGLKSFVDEKSLTAHFKTGNGANKKIVEKEITDYIPIFYHQADKQAYYDAYKAWFIIEGKNKTLDAKTTSDKVLKKKLLDQEVEAIQSLRQAAQKAFKWFVGGNNFCAEIYEVNPQNKIGGVPTKNAGCWESEIISNYNATVREARREQFYYWKERYPNARRIMSLKRNDMVLGTFTKEQAYLEGFPKGIQEYARRIFAENPLLEQTDILFRVKKIDSNGQIALTPHDIAKEEADTKSWRATAGSLQKYRARKVFVSPTGRILNAK